MYYTKEQIIEIMRDWLPVLRSSVNVTQADLCAAIGISRQTYSAIEIGKKEMSWTVFLALFMYFIANSRSRTLVRKKRKLCCFGIPLSRGRCRRCSKLWNGIIG